MIQRIQSLYLLLTTLLSLLFLNGSILTFVNKSGSVLKLTFSNILNLTEGQPPVIVEKLLPLSAIILLIPLLSVLIIFLFKNRKLQMRITIFLIALTAILILALVHVSMSVTAKFDSTIVFGYKMILPLLLLIFAILAYRGIKKDDLLVKSYDRLR